MSRARACSRYMLARGGVAPVSGVAATAARQRTSARTWRAKNLAPELDVYIAKAPPFAKPILTRLRALSHHACPEIGEALKWGHRPFEHESIVDGVAAFKPRHWKYMKTR